MHLADSTNIKVVTFNKRCSGLTGSCFESPNDTIHVTVGSKRSKNMDTIDIINLGLPTITASALVFASIQIKINRKQLFQSTITKCVSDFRDLGELNKETKETKIITKYIDLTNEELFYFQHNYIPKDVAKEWIDGMIDYLPITCQSGTILNADYIIRFLSDNRETILQNYPRIQNAFEVKGKYDFELIYSNKSAERLPRVNERKKIINEILKNLRTFDWFD